MTKPPAKHCHPPPSSPARQNSRQAASRTDGHWRRAMALQMRPQQPGLVSSCASLAQGHPMHSTFYGCSHSGQPPQRCPAPLALCAALRAKSRGCVLKKKFCKNSPEAGDDFYWQMFFLDSPFPQHLSALQERKATFLINIDRNLGKKYTWNTSVSPKEDPPRKLTV